MRQICPAAGPGDASCLALALVPARAGAAAAHAYALAGGAAETGPAGGLTPADLASAYHYSTAAGGGEQTVGIVDAFDDPTIEADLGTFDSHYGLPACTAHEGCLRKVSQTGSSTVLPAADTVGWSAEITLDVEIVHSVCPSCRILLVEAESERFSDLAAAVDEAVALGAGEVSNSYGGLEPEVGEPERAAYEHPGVVMVAAAGDSGWWSWDRAFETGIAPAVPDAPASLASVVSVGGTSLVLYSNGTRKSESVWNDSGRPTVEEFKQLAAGGGGCSTSVSAPSWQQSLSAWSATGCAGKRLDNDIAAVADPYTGFDIYDSYQYTSTFKTGWLTIGGTSLSSPLIASMYALADGARGASNPAATLYGHLGQAAALYDVTKGGNGYCDGVAPGPCGEPELNELLGPIDCEGTLACDARTGFDGPTGVGAPKGLGAFVAGAILKPSVVTLPATALTASGATLNATVNPNGFAVTSCVFEYGLTTSYGSSSPCSPALGTQTAPEPVSATVSGLAASTTYHFRVAATSVYGTSKGAAKTFKTAP